MYEILRNDEETPDELTESLVVNRTDENEIIDDMTINSSACNPDESRHFNSKNPFNFATINARSLSAKIGSLIDSFVNLELHFACLSETWLRSNESLETNIADLEESHSLSLITRNRSSRGGGVGIAYNTKKLRLKKVNIKTKFEYVCATGKSDCNKRPVFIVSYYIPPDMKAEDFRMMAREVEDSISRAKTSLKDPLIFLAGDSNRRDVSLLSEDFLDILNLDCPPSRDGAQLITCATNGKDLVKEMYDSAPLEDESGQLSDHRVIVVEMEMPRQDSFTKRRVRFRRYTTKGEEKFGSLLLSTQWDDVCQGDSDTAAQRLAETLQSYTNSCFPLCERMVKDSHLPWASRPFQRKVRQRNRCFKYNGRGRRWKDLKRQSRELLQASQKAFLSRIKDKKVENGSSKALYEAVKTLKHREAPKKWNIQNMFPDQQEEEIAERVAEYFNKISQEYSPADPPSPLESGEFVVPEIYQISGRLRSMKKPKGMLEGDIDPRLNNKYADILAYPLKKIYEKISATAIWPKLWKSEKVTIIPKNSCPSDLSELRNLSCTPLYSKLLESFVLDELKSKVRLSGSQYGGIKGCGVDHFLVETWNTLLSQLEDHRAASNLVSIDFEKAFNRMDHSACIAALRKKGASAGAIGMVSAFLSNRTMSVRIGEHFSIPRSVPGGSPQGSILANFLFCVTTESLASAAKQPRPQPVMSEREILSPIRQAIPRPIGYEAAASTPRRDTDSDTSSEADETIRFFRHRRPFLIDSSSDETVMMNQEEIDEFLGLPERWIDQEIEVQCYIDDFNNVEKFKIPGSVMHITTNQCQTLIHASKSQDLFHNVNSAAEKIKMIVNGKKTQMLCMHANSGIINSYINTGETRIVSGETLKILGFTFGQKPTAEAHVRIMLIKMRRRLWIIIHLKNAGMEKKDLVAVYFSMIRSVADFAAVAYHSLLTRGQSDSIEKIQLRAFKIIYGENTSYESVLKTLNYETLKQRRIKLLTAFALKTSTSGRFVERWFPLNNDVGYEFRTRKKYLEIQPRTERMKKNPMFVMRKILNDLNR